MAEYDSDNRYKPGPDFHEDNRAPVLPISMSDSTELWLIQWPINQLKAADFHGKEISLKLHRDGKLASFENSSGKSYDVVSFAAQEPDATVFLPSSSDSKVVGKISRRVCLVRYPEPGEFDEPSANIPNLSGLRLRGSKMKALSHLSSLNNHGSASGVARSSETLSFCPSIDQEFRETPSLQPRKKKHRDHPPATEYSRFNGQPSLSSQPETPVQQLKKKKHTDRTPATELSRSVGQSSLAFQHESHVSVSTSGLMKHRDRTSAPESSTSVGQLSHASQPDSQFTATTIGSTKLRNRTPVPESSMSVGPPSHISQPESQVTATTIGSTKRRNRTAALESSRSIGQSSLASQTESHATATAIGSTKSHGKKKMKKLKS